MLNTTRDTTGQRTHEPNSADASHSIRHVTSQVHNTLKNTFIQALVVSTFGMRSKRYMPRLWTLNHKSRDSRSRLEGYGICLINSIFFHG